MKRGPKYCFVWFWWGPSFASGDFCLEWQCKSNFSQSVHHGTVTFSGEKGSDSCELQFARQLSIERICRCCNCKHSHAKNAALRILHSSK